MFGAPLSGRFDQWGESVQRSPVSKVRLSALALSACNTYFLGTSFEFADLAPHCDSGRIGWCRCWQLGRGFHLVNNNYLSEWESQANIRTTIFHEEVESALRSGAPGRKNAPAHARSL